MRHQGGLQASAGILGRVADRRHHPGRTLLGARRGSLAAAAGPTADLAAVLEESVAAHMVADVPVASFLSGGLDSSLITAMAANRDPSIEAYTITFRPEDQRLEAMPDDAVYARKMAAHLGIRLHEIEISPDVVDMLPRIVDILDEPIGDPAAINTVLMCQAAREAGVKVLLSGMGADELFGGYRKHLACLLGSSVPDAPAGPSAARGSARAWTGSPLRPAGAGFGTPGGPSAFSSFAELPEEAAFRRSYSLYDPDELVALLDPELAPLVRRRRSTRIAACTPTASWPTTSTGCA